MDNMNSFFAAIALHRLIKSKNGFNDDGTPKQEPDKEEDFPP